MKKIILVASALVLASIIFIPYKKPTQSSLEILTIGTASGYAPFVSTNQTGEYEGFDIDVANQLATQLGQQLVIKDLGSISALFMALEQGSIDCIIWGLSITKDRLKKVAMVQYQDEQITSYPLLFWEKIPNNITSINDMAGKIISVEPASAQDAVLDNYPALLRQAVDKIDDAVLMIQYGKTDAALVEPAIARKFQKKYSQIKILPLPLAPEDQEQGIGIALKKNNVTLIQKIKQAIQPLQKNGSIKELEAKWNLS
jgi:polar amino acid transport system substrate-binding protein